MDRRRQIRMSEAELAAFLDAQRTVTCATIGPQGRPHLVALWYVPVGAQLDCWTYAASQKARNLERDPRAALTPQAAKRVGVRFHPTRVSTWDHRKLGRGHGEQAGPGETRRRPGG